MSLISAKCTPVTRFTRLEYDITNRTINISTTSKNKIFWTVVLNEIERNFIRVKSHKLIYFVMYACKIGTPICQYVRLNQNFLQM